MWHSPGSPHALSQWFVPYEGALTFVVVIIILFRSQDERHSQEVSRFQEELAQAHVQLQVLQKQLEEQLSKQPLANQEVGT